jgi:hypothetical protein
MLENVCISSWLSNITSQEMQESKYEEEEDESSRNSVYSSPVKDNMSNFSDDDRGSSSSSEVVEKEFSPPFKQGKLGRGNGSNMFNGMYANRMSMAADNYDNSMRASYAKNSDTSYFDDTDTEK